ncbi:MAG: hypothetical protein SOX65_08965 [Porphyromonas sp.]|uniref:plasmid mobilization protein n=1 Tax=Porphyromonas sp. TaxID=1924944 RepID=UPI002A8022D8|nr:hypothetical protein [Porphyromonas sp.]MDY4246589.1 hypothetical protein [Porphyromonas sp.]
MAQITAPKTPCPHGNPAPKSHSKQTVQQQMETNSNVNQDNGVAEKKQKVWNRWNVRLPNPEDQAKAIESFKRSGCDTKSDFVRKMILREDFHVVKANGDLIKFTTKLTDFIFAVNKIGVLYNQAVRAMNKYHSEEKAEQLLNNVSNQQMGLCQKSLPNRK